MSNRHCRPLTLCLEAIAVFLVFTIPLFSQAGGEIVHEQATLVIPRGRGTLAPKEVELRLRVVDGQGHELIENYKLDREEDVQRWIAEGKEHRLLLIDHYISMLQKLDADVARGRNKSTNAKIDTAKAKEYVSLAEIAGAVAQRRVGTRLEQQPEDQKAPQPAVAKDTCKDATPRMIHRADPQYTQEAKKAKIQGTVVMEILLNTDGSAKVQRVIKSLGFGLDESAVASVEHSTFARLPDGCTRTLNFEVNFNLR